MMSAADIKAKVLAAARKAGFLEVEDEAVKLLLKQVRKYLRRTQHNLQAVLQLCGASVADAAHVKAVLAIEHSCGCCPGHHHHHSLRAATKRGGRVAMPIQYFDTEAFPNQYRSSSNSAGEVNLSKVDPTQVTRPALPASFPATSLLAGGAAKRSVGASSICAEDVAAMLASKKNDKKGVQKVSQAAQRELADHLYRVLSGLLKCARAAVPEKHKRLTVTKLQAACQHHFV